jgi:uncharacterized membrane protein
MLGITPFGMFHTLISLVAVGAGIASLCRYHAISSRNAVGRTYLYMTALTCLTGFFIFHHGGFGKPHILGIVTLGVMAIAWLAERRGGSATARYVSTLGYSLTLFFHVIPAFTEFATRVPPGHPLVSGPDAQPLQRAIGAAFVVFLVGAALQVRGLRKGH